MDTNRTEPNPDAVEKAPEIGWATDVREAALPVIEEEACPRLPCQEN